ncbi:snakin-2-like protein [Carex littledalei]|uniref:Snakin-2-like protein n=1 Tax=Carex littledalei TaxID=544730 RepID=A0A833RFR3_9POAL|nr:snakin-2-like protein [Carex littledalei]
MAMKHVAFLLLFFLLVSSDGEEASREVADLGAPADTPALPPPHKIVDAKDCIGACDERCSLHSRKNVCSRACLTCCNTCRCVPAGTVGNRETCGKCYTEWKTHGNQTKCP